MTEIMPEIEPEAQNRAVLLGQMPSRALQDQFKHSIAVVIGINAYIHERSLRTARRDAERLAALLQDKRRDEHDRYDVNDVITLYDEEATAAALNSLIDIDLPARIKKAGPQTRVLFYFAGHGHAQGEGDRIEGFLFPHNADRNDKETLLAMGKVKEAVASLPCQHILLILDCCFAGALPQASLGRGGLGPTKIYWEYLQRYVRSKARQVITSAGHNQLAADVDPRYQLGERDSDDNAKHSPFAQALFEALDPGSQERGGAARTPYSLPVVTASHLYSYISEALYRRIGNAQTPGLSTINEKGHEQGEFVFLLPGTQVELKSAPDLTKPEFNPWPALQQEGLDPIQAIEALARQTPSFEQSIRTLAEMVESNLLVTVIDAYSAKNSSPVISALDIYLQDMSERRMSDGKRTWHILPLLNLTAQALLELEEYFSIQAGESPLVEQADPAIDSQTTLLKKLSKLAAQNPDKRLLLKVGIERSLLESDKNEIFAQLRIRLLSMVQTGLIHLVLILPQSDWSALSWIHSVVRYEVPPPNRDMLRQFIVQPALESMILFDPAEESDLFETLVSAVEGEPAALCILSETLHRLYLRFAEAAREGLRDDSRTLTLTDYKDIGQVTGVISNLAENLHSELPSDAHRRTAEKVLMRLVDVKDGSYVRRRVLRTEFHYSDPQESARVADVIHGLVTRGLAVVGEDSKGRYVIELGHSALFMNWPHLKDKLEDSSNQWKLQRELTAQVVRWEDGHQSSELWNDNSRLPQLTETLWPTSSKGVGGVARRAFRFLWLNTPTPADTKWLNQTEVAFVQASIKRNRQIRVFKISAVIFLFLVSSLLVYFGSVSRKEQRLGLTNESRLLASQAEQSLTSDPVESIRLSLSALPNPDKQDRPYVPEAEFMLTQALQTSLERKYLDTGMYIGNPSQIAPGVERIALGANRVWLVDYDLNDPVDLAGHEDTILGVEWGDATTFLTFDQNSVLVWQDRRQIANANFDDRVECAHWQPGGEYIVICSGNMLRLWSIQMNQKVELHNFGRNFRQARWSPDGRRLAAWTPDGTLFVWDTETDMSLEIPGANLWEGKWSPNSEYLVITSTDGSIYVWSPSSGHEPLMRKEHTDLVADVVFFDDESFVTWGWDGVGFLWDIDDEQSIRKYDPGESKGKMRGLIVPDTTVPGEMPAHFLTFTDSGLAHIWETASDTPLAELRGHTGSILAAAWHGDFVATAGVDGTVRVWPASDDWIVEEVAIVKEVAILAGHKGRVQGIQWLDDQRLLSYGEDGSLRIWQVLDADKQPLCGRVPTTNEFICFSLSQALYEESEENQGVMSARWLDDATILTTDVYGVARRWSLETSTTTVMGNEEDRQDAIWSPDGLSVFRYMQPGNTEIGGRIWSLEKNEPLGDPISGEVASAFWLKQGIFVSRPAGDAQLINPQTGQIITDFVGHTSKINDAQTNGNRLATVGADGTLYVWDLDTGKSQFHREVDQLKLTVVRWNQKGNQLLAAGEGPTVTLWNSETGEWIWKRPIAKILSAEYSPEEKYVVLAGNDQFSVLDTLGGELRWQETFDEPVLGAKWITGPKWDDEGAERLMLLTWGGDGTARLWDFETEREILRISAPGSISNAAISPDGTRLLTAQFEYPGTLRISPIWHSDPAILFEAAQQYLNSTGD